MKGTPTPQPVKDLIIERIKKGEKLDHLAKEFDIYPNTIRRWLKLLGIPTSNKSSTKSSEILMISKLQREKQELLEIIGELTVLTKQSKKKSSRT